MDELGQLRRERDGHRRGHGRLEGRHRHDQGHRGRQERERHGDGHGRAEAADDGVVPSGRVVDDGEGELAFGVRSEDAGTQRRHGQGEGRLVPPHDPGHEGFEGRGHVHGHEASGQQREPQLRGFGLGHGRQGRGADVEGPGPGVEAADDGVVPSGRVVDDGEGELAFGVRSEDAGTQRRHGRGVRWLVPPHDPGHEGLEGRGHVHGHEASGQQREPQLRGLGWLDGGLGRSGDR